MLRDLSYMKTRLLFLVALLLQVVCASAQPKSVKEVWINNGGRHIYGVLSCPEKTNGKSPIAIVSHGFNGTHEFSKNYFEPLNELGYQVFAFDFPCGSLGSKSDNNTMNMSVLDEVSDVKAIVNFFKQQPGTDASGIVLIGESQGGLVSALAASEMPDDVSRLVLVFPALCIPENWTARYPQLSDIPDTTRVWNVPLGRRFFEEVRDINPFKTIGKFRNPVVIIQGDADMVVSMDDSRRAVELYKDAQLHVIKGAGHGFKPEEFKESMTYIKAFLTQGGKQ